jgi:hypothetical protein
MAFPTDTILTAGTILRVQSALANRTLPSITITIGTGGAAIGVATVPITAPTSPAGLGRATGDVLVQQGSKLTFNETSPVTITLAEDIKVGDTTLVRVETTAALTAGKIATSAGLLQILGGDSVDFNVTDKEVATRSFENGLFDDARKVMIGGSLPFNGFYRNGDPCFDLVIKPSVLSANEVYFYLLRPDNTYWSGFAFIKGYKESMKLDDIVRFSWEFRAVGAFQTGIVPA